MSDTFYTFLIAPLIEEKGIHSWYDEPELVEMLRSSGLRPGAMLDGVLSTLAGGKPANGIELPRGRQPACNHFIGESELAQELAAEESSLARTNDGSVIREIYFNNATIAPVFSLDENIRLNRFRFDGFRQTAAMFARFDRECPGVLRAVTVAGELHHYVTNLADPNSAGRFSDVQFTDYSDASIRDFSAWLRQRHTSIEEVNERFGTPFNSWADVVPPRVDVFRQPEMPFWMHMDSYTTSVPIFGWADLEEGDRIEVFLDGERLGDARYHLSRVDVYDVLPHLAGSDVGFRYELEHKGLRGGAHWIHLVVQRRNGCHLLLSRRLLKVGVGGPPGNSYPHLSSRTHPEQAWRVTSTTPRTDRL
jgi:hypothetical protein